jgi:hypothetical protein
MNVGWPVWLQSARDGGAMGVGVGRICLLNQSPLRFLLECFGNVVRIVRLCDTASAGVISVIYPMVRDLATTLKAVFGNQNYKTISRDDMTEICDLM